MSIAIGVLFGCGTYLILRRQFLRMLLGFGLYAHAAHLILIVMGGYDREKLAPFRIPSPGEDLSRYMDPLPPDVILTAIVITFGVSALFLVLSYRTYQAWQTDDPEEL